MEARQTILVVDDVAMFRELESLFLARCGRVLTATSGEEAIAIIHEKRPDIVVLDLNLPDVDGETVCRLVKSDPEYADIPVILVTGSGDPADHARAIRAGAEDVLSKPLSRIALIDTVNRFVRFATPRGLPRVDLDTRVHLVWDTAESWGTIRNLSRGGMFIDTDAGPDRGTEAKVDFRLPESGELVTRTVQVMWRRERWNGVSGGLGVRFVDLDGALARNLDDYVHERAVPTAPPPVAGMGQSGAGR